MDNFGTSTHYNIGEEIYYDYNTGKICNPNSSNTCELFYVVSSNDTSNETNIDIIYSKLLEQKTSMDDILNSGIDTYLTNWKYNSARLLNGEDLRNITNTNVENLYGLEVPEWLKAEEYYWLEEEDPTYNNYYYMIGFLPYVTHGYSGLNNGIKPVININKDYFVINLANIKNGEVTYEINENGLVTLDLVPNRGFELGSITVKDDNGNNITLTNNTFNMPKSNVTINATFKPIEYKFTSGENSTYENEDLTFTLDGDYDLVDKVLVNNIELDSSNYIIKEGSTVITLKNEYLKTLSAGTYNLTVAYKNGTNTTTIFIIKDKQQEITNITDKDNIKDNNNENINNPQTYDNILFYVLLEIFSVIGLVSAGIYLRRTYLKKAR